MSFSRLATHQVGVSTITHPHRQTPNSSALSLRTPTTRIPHLQKQPSKNRVAPQRPQPRNEVSPLVPKPRQIASCNAGDAPWKPPQVPKKRHQGPVRAPVSYTVGPLRGLGQAAGVVHEAFGVQRVLSFMS